MSIPELGLETTLEDFLAHFDFFPDTRIFIKDRKARYLYSNQAYAKGLHTSPEELVGKSDFEFYPRNLAELYREEDQKVLASERFVNRRWMVPDRDGAIFWCLSNKFPLEDRQGKIQGIFGTFRNIEFAGLEARPFYDLAEVVAYIHDHYQKDIRSAELAEILGLSVSQLNRKFSEALGKSPIQYLVHVRVEKAAEKLLKSDDTVSEICLDGGFNSQTYFNRQFKRVTGFTPKEYRKQYQEV